MTVGTDRFGPLHRGMPRAPGEARQPPAAVSATARLLRARGERRHEEPETAGRILLDAEVVTATGPTGARHAVP